MAKKKNPPEVNPLSLTDEQRDRLAAWYSEWPRPESMMMNNLRDRQILFVSKRCLGSGEVRQIAALAVVRAAAKWEPSRSMFSTYAFRWIRWALLSAVRRELRRCRPIATGVAPETPVKESEPDETGLARASLIRIARNANVSKRGLQMLAMSKGLFDHDSATLDSIGEKVGLSKERTRQIIAAEVHKLKYYAERHPEEYIYRGGE